MKKSNLMAAAILAGLGVLAQAAGSQSAAVKPAHGKTSWSTVRVSLEMVLRKPLWGKKAAPRGMNVGGWHKN